MNSRLIVEPRRRPRAGVVACCVFAANAFLAMASCHEEPAGPTAGSSSLTDPTKRPRIVSTYPPNGGAGPFRVYGSAATGEPHFILELSKFVEQSTFLEECIAVEGFQNPVRVVPLRPSPEDPVYDPPPHLQALLPFAIRDKASSSLVLYEVERTYSVTIRSELTDFTGQRLLTPYRFSFVPEPRFRVALVSPAAGDRTVLPHGLLAVQFNSRVTEDIAAALRLSPDAPGAWRVAEFNPYRVEFRHPEPLPFDTEYTIEVRGSAMDAQGHTLEAPFSSAFSTRPFEIIHAEPAANDTAVAVTAGVNVQFSGETDSATVQPSFRIEPASAGQFYQAALTFSWQPEPELETSTTYRVTISTALRSAEGAPLGAPYEVTFTTVPFRVDTSWPPANSLGNPLGSDINVWCTANIDTTSVRSAFSIAPPVAGTLLLNDRSSTYRPVLLTPATEYTVTVSTALRSRRGAHRSAVHRFSFRTEGEP